MACIHQVALGCLCSVFSVGVGLIKQVHTLPVRSAQQVVHELQVREGMEGVRQEVREGKGESKVEASHSFHEHKQDL